MEDNKTPRSLNDEELQKVTGGFGFMTEAQCKELCEAKHTTPVMINGICNCMLSPDGEKV